MSNLNITPATHVFTRQEKILPPANYETIVWYICLQFLTCPKLKAREQYLLNNDNWSIRSDDHAPWYSSTSASPPISKISADCFQQTERMDTNQRNETAQNDLLMEEFLKAEVLMIDAPIYNFSVRAAQSLGRSHRASKSCRYIENGQVRLAGHKKHHRIVAQRKN